MARPGIDDGHHHGTRPAALLAQPHAGHRSKVVDRTTEGCLVQPPGTATPSRQANRPHSRTCRRSSHGRARHPGRRSGGGQAGVAGSTRRPCQTADCPAKFRQGLRERSCARYSRAEKQGLMYEVGRQSGAGVDLAGGYPLLPSRLPAMRMRRGRGRSSCWPPGRGCKETK
jgi:hypothetical protein